MAPSAAVRVFHFRPESALAAAALKLITAQGLNAHFGRADHGKRKRSVDGDLPTRKRQRI
jgi:hypothetical protein